MPRSSSPTVDVDSPQSPELTALPTMPDEDIHPRRARLLPDPQEHPPALLTLPPSLVVAAVEEAKPQSPLGKDRQRRMMIERKERDLNVEEEMKDNSDGNGDVEDAVQKTLFCETEPLQERENVQPERQSSAGDCIDSCETRQPLSACDIDDSKQSYCETEFDTTLPEFSYLPEESDETLPSPPAETESQLAPSSPSESYPEPPCARCMELYDENDHLSRKVARLRLKLQGALETAQTHGQRLLRAAYQEKVRELSQEHALKITEMLNMQKRCFEDELEAVDAESQAAVAALTRERDAEREARVMAEERFQREREAALEKTTVTMVAVQRKVTQLHARATRLDREKKSLVATVSEKQVMIEVLAGAAAAKDVERRRLDLLSKTQEEERERKDALVEALQAEVAQLREKLGQERQVSLNLIAQMDELEGERSGDRERHAEDLDDCKQQSKKEADRVGRLFASMIQDFTNVQSDVSTND